MRALDRNIAELVSSYLGGPLPQKGLFVPTNDNIQELSGKIQMAQREIDAVEDPFWNQHFTAALESLAFQAESNTKMPYEHVTRMSSSLDRLTSPTNKRTPDDQSLGISTLLKSVPSAVAAVGELAQKGTDLARSQVADVLPALIGNLERAIEFAKQNANDNSVKADAERFGLQALSAAKQVQSTVKSLPVGSLSGVDIPFQVSVEKGMQAPLDYILSWYEDDAQAKKTQFFQLAEEMFPGQNPDEVLDSGGGYDSVDHLFKDMRDILNHLQEECRRFVDLPDGEFCELGYIPKTWRMMVPGFMYMGGLVAINPDNLGYYRKADLETTASHEVYPGHHVHNVKSSENALPYTFRLPLFWSRCTQEGMCDRSMVMMTPYFKHPAARLSVAKRLWFTTARVKAEVDIYYNKKPTQSVIDNYVRNLGLPVYNAEAQTRAHLMRPADAVSYYTGMKYLDDLYNKCGVPQKDFTNELFSYGDIPLNTQKDILELSPEKKRQLKAFSV